MAKVGGCRLAKVDGWTRLVAGWLSVGWLSWRGLSVAQSAKVGWPTLFVGVGSVAKFAIIH